jgi:hypothetical protein
MKLELEATQKALSKFGKDVIIKAATYLQTRKRGYDTGKLMKSLDYDLGVAANSISLKIRMEDYGLAINEGRGKSGGGSGVLYPKILEWVKRKGLRPRNSKGQYEAWRNKAQQQRGIAYVVTRKIHRFGYKGTGFFDDAFAQSYKKLPKKLTQAFALDLENFLNFTIDEINGNNGNTQ